MGTFINLVKKEKGKIFSVIIPRSSIYQIQEKDFINQNASHPLHDDLNASQTDDCNHEEEGLVVVDFDAKWIGSNQNYTKINEILATDIFKIKKGEYVQSSLKKVLESGFISDINIVKENLGIFHIEKMRLLDVAPSFFETLKNDKAMEKWLLEAINPTNSIFNSFKNSISFVGDVYLDSFVFAPPRLGYCPF